MICGAHLNLAEYHLSIVLSLVEYRQVSFCSLPSPRSPDIAGGGSGEGLVGEGGPDKGRALAGRIAKRYF